MPRFCNSTQRKTQLTPLKKVIQKTAENVAVSYSVLSITADNGSEFAKHGEIAEQLNTDFFFAHPYSCWELGLNENTNYNI
ncbi:Integrase, catalytic region (fragment) [Legionella hackeliae]|uniref:Integrase, catalytic region n=1 Tax=Legionella hackeliae TaxID=449 RepID=A0A0A8UTS7_LEGHA